MITLSRCLSPFALLLLYASAYQFVNNGYRHHYISRTNLLSAYTESQNYDQSVSNQDTKSSVPSSVPKRNDVCKIFLSGTIGTEPKEAYLSNDHYVVNFALAVIGHFDFVHDWEKMKPTETMWMSVEVWDSEAKNNLHLLRKGAQLNGIGTMIFNKWVDKASGEERKQFKCRLLKIISAENMESLLDSDHDVNTNNMDNNQIEMQAVNMKTEEQAPLISPDPRNEKFPNFTDFSDDNYQENLIHNEPAVVVQPLIQKSEQPKTIPLNEPKQEFDNKLIEGQKIQKEVVQQQKIEQPIQPNEVRQPVPKVYNRSSYGYDPDAESDPVIKPSPDLGIGDPRIPF